MKLTYIVSLLSLMVSLAPSIQAQEYALNAAGGNQDIGNDTYGFSIGEMVLVQTFTSSTIVVTQGLLQPSSAPLGISDGSIKGQNLKIYPNPAKNTIYLEAGFPSAGNLSARLYDALGREISTYTFSLSSGKERQEIDCSAIPAGTYLLKVVFLPKDPNAATYQTSYKIQRLP